MSLSNRERDEVKGLVVVGVVLLAMYCFLASCVNVTTDQGQTVSGPTTVSGPSAPAPGIGQPPGCKAVARVGTSARNAAGNLTTTLRVGESVRLDATPKAADGALIEPTSCHAPTVTWTVSGAPCALTGAQSGFNPDFVCSGSGTVSLTATLGPGPGQGISGTLVLQVNP